MGIRICNTDKDRDAKLQSVIRPKINSEGPKARQPLILDALYTGLLVYR